MCKYAISFCLLALRKSYRVKWLPPEKNNRYRGQLLTAPGPTAVKSLKDIFYKRVYNISLAEILITFQKRNFYHIQAPVHQNTRQADY